MCRRRVVGPIEVREDTSDYLSIDFGTVLRLDGNDYFVSGHAKEGRFGIDDQPKVWVKNAYDLSDGRRVVIKLVFMEHFSTTMGPFKMRCHRSPEKESAVLKSFAGDSRFMQGRTIIDPAGNNVRVLEFIHGMTLFNAIPQIEMAHEAYYCEALPGILEKIAGCIEAIADLHEQNLSHGDVRNDHIIIDKQTGEYRWIDFDYSVNFLDYDIWSMGNLLTYATAKGMCTVRQSTGIQEKADLVLDPIISGDALLFYEYRVANLRKIYPYILPELNNLLMRFSASTTDYFENVRDVADELRRIIPKLG